MAITLYGCPWLLLEIARAQGAHTDRQQASFLHNACLGLPFHCHAFPNEWPAISHPFIPSTLPIKLVLIRLPIPSICSYPRGLDIVLPSTILTTESFSSLRTSAFPLDEYLRYMSTMNSNSQANTELDLCSYIKGYVLSSVDHISCDHYHSVGWPFYVASSIARLWNPSLSE